LKIEIKDGLFTYKVCKNILQIIALAVHLPKVMVSKTKSVKICRYVLKSMTLSSLIFSLAASMNGKGVFQVPLLCS
jgi:hypothetical protein